VMASIRRFLEQELRLQVNEKKSKVAPVEECGCVTENSGAMPGPKFATFSNWELPKDKPS